MVRPLLTVTIEETLHSVSLCEYSPCREMTVQLVVFIAVPAKLSRKITLAPPLARGSMLLNEKKVSAGTVTVKAPLALTGTED